MVLGSELGRTNLSVHDLHSECPHGKHTGSTNTPQHAPQLRWQPAVEWVCRITTDNSLRILRVARTTPLMKLAFRSPVDKAAIIYISGWRLRTSSFIHKICYVSSSRKTFQLYACSINRRCSSCKVTRVKIDSRHFFLKFLLTVDHNYTQF